MLGRLFTRNNKKSKNYKTLSGKFEKRKQFTFEEIKVKHKKCFGVG